MAEDEIGKLVGCQWGLFFIQVKSLEDVFSHLSHKQQKEFVFY